MITGVENGRVDASSRAGLFPLYLTGEDALRLTVFNAATGVTVQIAGRFLPDDGGDISPFVRTLPGVTTDRLANTLAIGLGAGWLLDYGVSVSAGTPLVGQTFAIISLVHGVSSSSQELSTLGQAYITAKQRLLWPSGQYASSLDGGGALRSIAGTTPGAGVDVSEAVPAGARWKLLAFRAQLVTAVAVANRSPQLTLDDGANELQRAMDLAAVPASTTLKISWAPGMTNQISVAGGAWAVSLGDELWLAAGHRIRTLTGSLQAADQWSAVQYLVQEFLEGA